MWENEEKNATLTYSKSTEAKENCVKDIICQYREWEDLLWDILKAVPRNHWA